MEIVSAPEFLRYYEGIRARTRRVVELIPEEKLEWAHAPGRFTFGDVVRHLAGVERWMFAENAAGRPSRYPGHDRALAEGLGAATAYLDELHAAAMEIFASLSSERLNERCSTPAGASIPVWKWLRAMVEHEVHHRGQLYLMLGMIGVSTPPLYGLTSEEVRERSLPPGEPPRRRGG